MRAELTVDAFFTQSQPLLYAEAVLLVDDGQCQVVKLHLGLEQCMGTDHHGRAAGDLLQRGCPRLALELAGQPGGFDAKWLEPFAEI